MMEVVVILCSVFPRCNSCPPFTLCSAQCAVAMFRSNHSRMARWSRLQMLLASVAVSALTAWLSMYLFYLLTMGSSTASGDQLVVATDAASAAVYADNTDSNTVTSTKHSVTFFNTGAHRRRGNADENADVLAAVDQHCAAFERLHKRQDGELQEAADACLRAMRPLLADIDPYIASDRLLPRSDAAAFAVEAEIGAAREKAMAKLSADMDVLHAAAAPRFAGATMRQWDDAYGGGLRSRGTEHEADIAFVYDFVHRQQHPAPEVCASARLLLVACNSFSGFASQIRFLPALLQLGAASNRTVVMRTPTQYSTVRHRSLLGYLDDFTSCTIEGEDALDIPGLDAADQPYTDQMPRPGHFEALAMVLGDKRIVQVLPMHLGAFRVNELALYRADFRLPVRRDYGRLWLFKETMRYVFRLQRGVADELDVLIAATGIDVDAPYIGVHVRHGDKHQGCYHRLQDYAVFVMKYAADLGVRQVWLSTDDPDAVRLLPATLRELDFFFLPPDLFPSSNEHAHVALELKTKHNYASGLPDQAMLMLAEIVALSRATVAIGQLSSNIDRLVYELKMLQPNTGVGATVALPAYVDMDANSWVSGQFDKQPVIDLQTGRKYSAARRAKDVAADKTSEMSVAEFRTILLKRMKNERTSEFLRHYTKQQREEVLQILHGDASADAEDLAEVHHKLLSIKDWDYYWPVQWEHMLLGQRRPNVLNAAPYNVEDFYTDEIK